MAKHTHGIPRASLDERTERAAATSKASVVVGPCVGPRYRGVAYQAVQQLRCEECRGEIIPGEQFTRRGLRWGIGLHVVCQRCAPFELVDGDGATPRALGRRIGMPNAEEQTPNVGGATP